MIFYRARTPLTCLDCAVGSAIAVWRLFCGANSEIMKHRTILIALSLCALAAAQTPSREFVTIQSGTFRMGCSEGDMLCDPDENPPHDVRISKPFELATHEVTRVEEGVV